MPYLLKQIATFLLRSDIVYQYDRFQLMKSCHELSSSPVARTTAGSCFRLGKRSNSYACTYLVCLIANDLQDKGLYLLCCTKNNPSFVRAVRTVHSSEFEGQNGLCFLSSFQPSLSPPPQPPTEGFPEWGFLLSHVKWLQNKVHVHIVAWWQRNLISPLRKKTQETLICLSCLLSTFKKNMRGNAIEYVTKSQDWMGGCLLIHTRPTYNDQGDVFGKWWFLNKCPTHCRLSGMKQTLFRNCT